MDGYYLGFYSTARHFVSSAPHESISFDRWWIISMGDPTDIKMQVLYYSYSYLDFVLEKVCGRNSGQAISEKKFLVCAKSTLNYEFILVYGCYVIFLFPI